MSFSNESFECALAKDFCFDFANKYLIGNATAILVPMACGNFYHKTGMSFHVILALALVQVNVCLYIMCRMPRILFEFPPLVKY